MDRSRCRSRRDIDYLSLNDGLDDDALESPKRRKRVSYTLKRKGPSAGRVAVQCSNSPENSLRAETVSKPTALKGVQSPPAKPASETTQPSIVSALTGVPSTTTSSLLTLIGIQATSGVSLPDTASLPAVPVLTGVPSMPENITQISESVDKLPDLVTNMTDVNETDAVPKPTTYPDPIETFNVDPLSTEEEMDTVDALLSLQDLRDDTVDPLNENAQLMSIGGVNLPVDAAPVPLELDQVQVDHAIVKITKQEEEEATANDGTTQVAVDPVTANIPTQFPTV